VFGKLVLKATMKEPILSAPLEWVSLKDDYPEVNEESLWCRVPICEPPTVASMAQVGFYIEYFTHFARLKNEHFPICTDCNVEKGTCDCIN
jgi:hypothetical protein